MSHRIRGLAERLFGIGGLSTLVLLWSAFSVPAEAAVSLRVEGRPATAPIQAFVRVTSAGQPVEGLTAADFAVRIDGVDVPLQGSSVTRPPAEDPDQHVSVVFVMDYTPSVLDAARPALEAAVNEFIDNMRVGDMAAIIKFNNDTGASVIIPFTGIDDGGPNDDALHAAVISDYPGRGSNILDAAILGVSQFTGVTLPDGPKAVILVTDGLDTSSTSKLADVIESANTESIPLFTIGVGTPGAEGEDVLENLAFDTGGQYFPAPTEQDISDAYASVSTLISTEYLITIPNTSITDCAEHELEVTVNGETDDVLFTRRTCDTEPDAFSFQSATNLKPGQSITSQPATISGIEVPAHISVLQGQYSIGCTSTFTRDPGEISDGQTVCIKLQASDQPGASKTATLTIGGVAGTFTGTTRASGGGGGGGGGGGSTGLPELLMLLGALGLVRRRAD